MYGEEQPMRFLWYVPLPLFDRLFPELRVLSPDARSLSARRGNRHHEVLIRGSWPHDERLPRIRRLARVPL